MTGYLDRWIEFAGIDKSFKALNDLVVREQVVNICSKDLVLFIKEHVPKDVHELTCVAEQFREARMIDITRLITSFANGKPGQPRSVDNAGKPSKASHQDKVGRNPFNSDRDRGANQPREKRFYRCGRTGHIASDRKCPNRSNSNNVSAVQESRERSLRVRFRDTKKATRSKSTSPSNAVCSPATCNAFLPNSDVLLYNSPSIITSPSVVSNTQMTFRNLPTANGKPRDMTVSVLRDTCCSGVVVRRSLVGDESLTGCFRHVF